MKLKKIMFNDRYGLTQDVLEGRKTMTRRFVPDRMAQLLDVSSKGVLIIPRNSIPDSMTPEQFAEEFAKHPGVIVFEKNDVKEVKPAIDIREECIKLAPYKVGEVVAVAQNYHDVYEVLKRTHGSSSRVTREFFHKYVQGGRMPVSNKMFVRADLMPHQIRITDIKVERLQDISEEDCLKEGIQECFPYIDRDPNDKVRTFQYFKDGKIRYRISPASECFAHLIDDISGKGTWESNPYCFCYEFELVK